MAPATPVESSNLNLAAVSTVVTLVLGVVTVLVLFWQRDRGDGRPDKRPEAEEEEEEEEERQTQEIAPEDMPPGAVFTIESLAPFNGVEKPICMGVCGKVVNVSSSQNIQAGAGYGKLWAGKDATYSLAMVSLNPDDANKLDFKLSDFDDGQFKALAGWYKHFTSKYPIVGTMKEYEGWDFSEVAKAAEKETPFASKAKDSDTATGAAKPAEQEEEVAGAVMLKRGDRVRIQGVEGKPEVDGCEGDLEDFDAKEGCFLIKLDGIPIMYERVKPSNLVKLG